MTDRCAIEALAATANKLSSRDLESIRTEADRILKARELGFEAEDAMRAEIRRAAIDKVKGAKLRKAQIADADLKGRRLDDIALTEFRSRPWEAFRAALGNVARPVRGARVSVRNGEGNYRYKYIGQFNGRLLDDGDELAALFHSGKADQEVSRALWELNAGRDPALLVPDGKASDNAIKIARAMHDTLNQTIVDAESRLMPIDPNGLYVARTSHDPIPMKRDGYEKWFATFKEHFDLRIPADAAEFQRVALGFYNDNIAGAFRRKADREEMPGYKSRARSNAQERAFVPKSADSWYAYNQIYGGGNLRETFSQTLLSRAKDMAFADVGGVTAEKTIVDSYQRVLDALRDDPKTRLKMQTKLHGLIDVMHQANGAANEVVDDAVAAIHQSWRGITSTAIYGGSVLAQPSDIAFAASMLRQMGWSKKGGAERGILSYAFDVASGIRLGQNKDAIRYLEYVANDWIHFIGEEGSLTRGTAGWINRNVSRYFRLNMMTQWTSRLQVQIGSIVSMDFGSRAGRAFNELPDGSRMLFEAHEIGAREWNVIRQGVQKAENGANVITAKAIRDLPDDVFATYKAGTEDARSIAALREDLSGKWRTFLYDRIATGSNQPGYRARATLTGGTQAGTHLGEGMRDIAMVKSFPAEVIYSSVARELYGYGATNLREALTSRAVGVGMGKMFFMATVLGYLSMSARDALQGKEPRDPLDPRTMMMSMLRGGALGFYGDALFGAAEKRFGMNVVSAMMGPQAQQIADVADIGARALKITNRGDDEKLAAGAVRTIYRNLPGNNLFFVKPIVDYTFMYALMDELSPGYLRRMERTLERETGQSYFLSPQGVR